MVHRLRPRELIQRVYTVTVDTDIGCSELLGDEPTEILALCGDGTERTSSESSDTEIDHTLSSYSLLGNALSIRSSRSHGGASKMSRPSATR